MYSIVSTCKGSRTRKALRALEPMMLPSQPCAEIPPALTAV